MSSESEHKRGGTKGEFCTAPGNEECDCGNNYRDVCKPIEGKSWSNYVTLSDTEQGPRETGNPFEAHHVLCVSCVTEEMLQKESIETVIEQTEWCINKKTNMVAMPLWGHTVKWYCEHEWTGGRRRRREPPFADLPQHDVDHKRKVGGYLNEVTTEVRKVANQVEKAKHKIKPTTIAGKLDKLSGNFKSKLRARGRRSGGTDNGWQMGLDDAESLWYMPFSMSLAAEVRKFPIRNFDEKKADWIKRLKDAFLGGP